MSFSKYQSFWPLPGGVENYVQSINGALAYIRDNKPTHEQLENWLITSFPKLTKPRLAKHFVDITIRHTGLVISDKDRITLSEDGETYLAKPNSELLFQIFDKNIVGFSETLEALGRRPQKLEELNSALLAALSSYQLRWTTTAQAAWRAKWLQAMGFVRFRDHRYELTSAGRQFLEGQSGPIPEMKPMIEKIGGAEAGAPVPPLRLGSVDDLVGRLKAAEHASSDPQEYERVIADALAYLGLETEHLGAPGEADVIARAHLGDEGYTAILDGKTTSGEKVTDRHVGWPVLVDHREKYDADYVVVVGPGFAGGDLVERATKYKVGLLDTNSLVELLTIHSSTPLTLQDLREIFSKVGPIRLHECERLTRRLEEYAKQLEILHQLVLKLNELQPAGESTTVSDLRWALERKFSTKDIQWALDLLGQLGIVQRSGASDYLAVVNSNVAAAKFKAIANVLSPGQP